MFVNYIAKLRTRQGSTKKEEIPINTMGSKKGKDFGLILPFGMLLSCHKQRNVQILNSVKLIEILIQTDVSK